MDAFAGPANADSPQGPPRGGCIRGPRARLALQSDGVVGTVTCVARGAAVPATERLKQIAGAHTAAIRMLPLPPQSPGVWSMEPLAAMAADFPPSLKSKADNRQQCFVHVRVGGRNATNAARCCLLTTRLRACGVRPLFSRIDERLELISIVVVQAAQRLGLHSRREGVLYAMTIEPRR